MGEGEFESLMGVRGFGREVVDRAGRNEWPSERSVMGQMVVRGFGREVLAWEGRTE